MINEVGNAVKKQHHNDRWSSRAPKIFSPSFEEDAMHRAQENTPALDRRVLDGISVAALLAIAVFFLWLMR